MTSTLLGISAEFAKRLKNDEETKGHRQGTSGAGFSCLTMGSVQRIVEEDRLENARGQVGDSRWIPEIIPALNPSPRSPLPVVWHSERTHPFARECGFAELGGGCLRAELAALGQAVYRSGGKRAACFRTVAVSARPGNPRQLW